MGTNASSDGDTFEDAVNETASVHDDTLSGTKDMANESAEVNSEESHITTGQEAPSTENSNADEAEESTSTENDSSGSINTGTPKSNLPFLYFFRLEVTYKFGLFN